MREEGCGESNRVNYAYTFSSEAWFGSYECRVHRYLLESPSELVTNQFEVGGHAWQLKLICKDDGNLGACLYSRSQETITAHYCFSIINRDNEDKCTVVCVGVFQPNKSSGVFNLTSVASIKDKTCGFLVSDIFTVKLDVRLSLSENETHSLSTDNTSGIYTWNLKSLSGMSPRAITSEEFSIGGLKWKLGLFPRGESRGTQYMSFYLHSRNDSIVQTKIKLSALNSGLFKRAVSHKFDHVFGYHGNGMGTSRFLKIRALEDEGLGFLKDGWITLTVHVLIKGQRMMPSDQEVAPQPRAVPCNLEEPKCIFCIDRAQTSGVLHGDTTHKCYCLECARFLKDQNNLNCPICGQRVERIIEMF